MNEQCKSALEQIRRNRFVLEKEFDYEYRVLELTLNQAEEEHKELKELREFAKVLCKMKIVDSNHKIYGINENDIALIKKVVEKYGKQSNFNVNTD